jgi:hypothetical protein
VGPVVFAVQIDGEPPEDELRPVSSAGAGAGEEEPVALGEADEDAGTLEHAGGGAGNAVRGNGGGSHADLDLEELQPVGDNEDAAFDALTAEDDLGGGELEIDLDAEEQKSVPPPPR